MLFTWWPRGRSRDFIIIINVVRTECGTFEIVKYWPRRQLFSDFDVSGVCTSK